MTSLRNHNTRTSTSTIFGSTLVCALLLAGSGCGGAGSVSGGLDLIDLRSETLLNAEIQSVNGTYGAGCTDRDGDWSTAVELGAMLDNPELSVVLNDDGCVLTLTELHTDGGVLVAVPAIALTTSYKMTPSAFDDPIQFYGNAKLSSVSYAADFTLTFLYSDDPDLATDANTAEFEVIQSAAMGDSVSVPDYTIDPDTLTLLTDTDQIVQSAGGGVDLTAGAVAAQTYVVVDASGLDTYAELDDAYTGATPAAIADPVPAAAFDLVGEDLDAGAVKRTIILANIESGVASYQAFEITFNPAPAL